MKDWVTGRGKKEKKKNVTLWTLSGYQSSVRDLNEWEYINKIIWNVKLFLVKYSVWNPHKFKKSSQVSITIFNALWYIWMNIHTYIPICICKYTYIKDTCLNKKLMSKFIMKIFLHFFLQKSELTSVLSRILFFANIMQFGVCMCVYKYVCVCM